MPKFTYVAMDKVGKETKGTLEVANQNEAIGRVKEMGLFPTKIVELDKEKPEKKGKAVKTAAKAKPAGKGKKAVPAVPNVIEDALSALVHLGYGRSEAFSVVMRLQQEKPEAKLDVLIRDSLRELAA